jgi:cytosine/adenosine deaminase-related metal-dependent hydrolase
MRRVILSFVVCAFLGAGLAAQQPPAGYLQADILRAITINGYKIAETEKTRGPIKAGNFADLIARPGSPLDDVDALKNVRFVMKDGQVFKRDGVMTPGGVLPRRPVNGWRIR